MPIMTRAALVSHISEEIGVSKKQVNSLLSELVLTAIRQLKKTGEFTIPGLGSFVTRRRAPRMGRNPQTGAAIKIVPFTTIGFRMASEVEKRVAGGAPTQPRISYRGKGSGVGPSSKGPLRRGEKLPNYSVLRIFYATDRELTSEQPPRYGHRRNPKGEINLGTCDVSIPRDPRHHTANIERPSIWHFEFRENPDKHFVIKTRTIKPTKEFYAELSQVVAKSENKEAFVFVHGFRVAFDDAVYRTAQIAYDLGFPGAPVLYSWPSNGSLFEYTGDINNNDWTIEHLKSFLRDLCSQSGARTLHLIAHSMGNRALCNALNLLATQFAPVPPILFNQVVLTAPDIDAGVFVQLADAIKSVAARVTLYGSTRDKALRASMKKNSSYPRAGDLRKNVVVVDGIDTIDASAVDTNLIGHFFYAENRSVLSDLFILLKDGSPPEKRFGLHRVDKNPPYWAFAP